MGIGFLIYPAFLAVFLATTAALILSKGRRLSGLLLALGSFGFFTPPILPSTGRLLQQIELPTVFETTTIEGPDGRKFAATTHLARVQCYSPTGEFEAGWFVDSRGGAISIGLTNEGTIAIATARTKRVEFFNPNGSAAGPSRPFTRRNDGLMRDLLQPSDYSVDGVTFENPILAPAPRIRWSTFLLFPLWSPFIAWLLIICAMLPMIIARIRRGGLGPL
jgi:hypothetical protein